MPHKTVERYPRLAGIPDQVTRFFEIPSLDEYRNVSVTWAVEGLIPRGSLTFLIAPPGGYKTWFALALAKAVSQGTEFLGRPTSRMLVCYLDRENSLEMMLQRRDILKLDDKCFLKIWGNWSNDPPPLIGDDRLEEFARRHKPFIIFDSFVRFHPSEENNATQMAVELAKLKKLATLGATVHVLHHKGKSGVYRGSTDILAAPDAAFEINEEKNKLEPVLTLSCLKHRYVEESSVKCNFVLRDGSLQLVDNNQTHTSSASIKRIKEAIFSNPGITQKEIMSTISLPETNGRKILQEGNGVHWITERGTGKTLRYFPKP
jgi:AAA domain